MRRVRVFCGALAVASAAWLGQESSLAAEGLRGPSSTDPELPRLGGETSAKWKFDHCALNIWGISDHNDRGTHNEHNTGLGLRCYMGKRWFLQVDNMKNSMAQPTQDTVVGAEFQIAKVGDVKLLGAGSFGFIRYERPNKKEPVEGWVPVPTLVLRYKDRVDVNCIPVNLIARGQRIRIFFITLHF